MKFLICGTLVPIKYETKIKCLSNAGNRFLTNFCSALKKQGKVVIQSYVGIPVEKDIQQAMDLECQDIKEISYNYASKYKLRGVLQYQRAVKKQIKEVDYVVAYNAVYAWLFLPLWVKHEKKSVLILADYSPKESFQGVFRRLYALAQLKSIRKYDYVVGLSENVRGYLQVRQHFICMEGGIAQEFYDFYSEEKLRNDGKIIIQYAGVLEPVTGIDRLISAFSKIENSNYVLRVSGRGSLKELVEKASACDTRIEYLGCQPYEQYMKVLHEADILINPRNMELKENENNFPSKIMEYLATGKYIISTKFPGWERYDKYIDFCQSDVKSIKEQLVKTIENVKERKNNLYAERRTFAEQFIWERQIERFITFLDESE